MISEKYPSFRDDVGKSGYRWLDGKRMDDGADGLWRIHNTLYDFDDFIDRHPGGSDWLTLTKGTDITELFESHHISLRPQTILPKYKVKDVKTSRNYKLTFKENGFYNTLKKRVRDELPKIDRSPELKSKLINDLLIFLTFFTSILSSYTESYIIVAVSGIFLTWTTISSHNYFHRKDNWRMLFFNLSFMSYRDWRITHAMSHHMYANSKHDLEMSMFEPFLCWLPTPEKNIIQRYISWIYGPIIYSILYLVEFIKRICISLFTKDNIFYKEDLIPFLLPTAMYMLGGSTSLFTVLKIWISIVLVGSFIFGFIGLNAAHHHPDVAHDSDKLRDELDWGIFQLETIMDRSDTKGSQFLVQTHFGEHALHHLFPTLDHGILPQLKKILTETCKEFQTEVPECSGLHHFIGQHQQLARIVPTTIARDFRNKKCS